MELTGANIIIECLKAEGVDYVFGYPGGAVLHIYDAFHQQDEVEHILVRHEQGATHAADFIHSCLHLSDFPTHQVAAHDMDLFHTVAMATVPENINIVFDGAENCETKTRTIHFLPDLDHLNFSEYLLIDSLKRGCHQ